MSSCGTLSASKRSVIQSCSAGWTSVRRPSISICIWLASAEVLADCLAQRFVVSAPTASAAVRHAIPGDDCIKGSCNLYASKAWREYHGWHLLVPDQDTACLTSQALGSHRRERDAPGGVAQDQTPPLMMREPSSAPRQRTGRLRLLQQRCTRLCHARRG